MTKLAKGANAPVTSNAIRIEIAAAGADVSAYMLGADGKVRADEDFIFYNQATSTDGSVSYDGHSAFDVNLARVDPAIDRIAFCATPERGTIADIDVIGLRIVGDVEFYEATTGMTEAAIIIGELYRRAGAWKIRGVAQGFNGGLAALSRHFGVDVAEDAQPAPAPTPPSAVDLRKQRLVSLEKSDPKLVSLAKSAAVSLEKKNLKGATAKVVLALDISGSMGGIYRSGQVDRTTQRVLALALNMDDDGRIPVYAFGSGAYRIGEADAANYQTFIPDMLRQRSLEGSTHYGKVIQMIRSDFAGDADFGAVPIYVLFVTDGATSDKVLTEREIRQSAEEGIFWQFVGIREGAFHSGFDFLEKLDDMKGRKVDNCDFFEVASLDEMTDDMVFDKLMAEYPGWITAARSAGVLR